MKICVVQAKALKGDIQRNIDNHQNLISLAIAHGAGIIIFPELSVTGYEPSLAGKLATDIDDQRFDDFQAISNDKQVTIGVGMPLKNNTGVSIGMIIFQPGKVRQAYFKKYLHADEDPFFVSGENFTGPIGGKTDIALAICYELSVPEHSATAHKRGATIYLTSVAKTATGVEKAVKSLSDIATNYSMTVLMANCAGQCDAEECGGKTSIWNNKGVLAGQLDDTNEGILMIDTETGEVIEITV